MPNRFDESMQTSDLLSAGSGTGPSLADCIFPSGIGWVDRLIGCWCPDTPTAVLVKGYGLTYFRLLHQVFTGFSKVGGQVEYCGRLSDPESFLEREVLAVDNGFVEQPPWDGLDDSAKRFLVHLPERFSDLPGLIPATSPYRHRMILLDSLEWLASRGEPRAKPRAKLAATQETLRQLQQVADERGAAVVVLDQYQHHGIPQWNQAGVMFRDTISLLPVLVGAVIIIARNPRKPEQVFACGGETSGPCRRVRLNPCSEGWTCDGVPGTWNTTAPGFRFGGAVAGQRQV